MKLIKIFVATLAVAATVMAQADTRLIEGKGGVKNREGVTARFEMRVAQINDQAATGKFAFGFQRGDAMVYITCERPRYVHVREHEGRFEGPAKVTVKRGTDIKSWEGNVFFTGWDLKPAVSGKADRLRVRFIRNPFESPEGDFFFEGEVVDGDLVVKKF